MNIIRRLLGSQVAEAGDASTQHDGHAESKFIEAGSRNATRRELIRVVLRDTLRLHGIPASWLQCEVLIVATRKQQTSMHVRLIIKHWDERLLKHSLAFAQSFTREIERFESEPTDWLHSISWQVAADSGCPYTEMPDPSVWSRPQVLEDPEAEVKEDLERLFAIRDLENARHAASVGGPAVSDFQQTQPSSLETRPDPL